MITLGAYNMKNTKTFTTYINEANIKQNGKAIALRFVKKAKTEHADLMKRLETT